MINKHPFYYIRYLILALPIMGLLAILTNTSTIPPISDSDQQNQIQHRLVKKNNPNKEFMTPQQITTLLDIEGIKTTINTLETQHQWPSIYEYVSQGKDQWISLIPTLINEAPKVVQQHLTSSLSKALLKNPEAVLNILSISNHAQNKTNMICSSKNFSTNQKNNLIQTLYNLHSLNISYQKQSCLQTLKLSLNQTNIS